MYQAPEDFLGKEIDGYHLLAVLGQGGMGIVYKAEEVELARLVALKTINPELARNETFRNRFRSEARALARIRSPYIVGIHTLRPRTELGAFIVMEFVDGDTLTHLVRNEGPLDLKIARTYIGQMLRALHDAHSVGVIHRDIKPRNVMIDADGTVKVTDFGLAKLQQGGLATTMTQGMAGTLPYMSPEQFINTSKVDHRSDLYSMGMTIYELLTGRLPFDKKSGEFAIMNAIVKEPFQGPDAFRPDLPRPLVQVVMQALAKSPDDRFPSAQAMFKAFDQAFRGDGPRMIPKRPEGSPAEETSRSEPTRSVAPPSVEAEATAPPSQVSRQTGSRPPAMQHTATVASHPTPSSERVARPPVRSAVQPERPAMSDGPEAAPRPSYGGDLHGDAQVDARPGRKRNTVLLGTLGMLVLALGFSIFMMQSPGDDEAPPDSGLARTAQFVVRTEPALVDVYVNNEPFGPSPLDNLQVEGDSVRLGFEKEGYQRKDTTVAVVDGAEVFVQLRPTAATEAPGRLVIRTEPGDAAVYLNDHPAEGIAGGIAVAPGTHRVRVERPGYAPQTLTVRVDAGQEFAETVTLAAVEVADPPDDPPVDPPVDPVDPPVETVARAPLNARAEPGGQIRIRVQEEGGGYDETFTGAVTESLPAGRRYTLTFLDPTTDATRDTTVFLGEGTPVSITCYFEALLNINTRPADGSQQNLSAEIEINGESFGVTPQSITVKPGLYEVSVNKFGYVAEPASITVRVVPAFEKDKVYPAIFRLREEPPGP